MSVVRELSPGWLLDHLSFINKISYELHQHHEPCCSKNEPISSVHLDTLHMDSMSSFGASATCIASTTKPENDDGGNCEMLIQKYVFRSELFDVTKPYITSDIHKECQQSNEKEDRSVLLPGSPPSSPLSDIAHAAHSSRNSPCPLILNILW